MNPDAAQVPINNKVVWDNQDTVPHTATSGAGPSDPNSAQLFDTSIINGGEKSAAIELKGVSEGQTIPYHCTIHPYMTSEITVSSSRTRRPTSRRRQSNRSNRWRWCRWWWGWSHNKHP